MPHSLVFNLVPQSPIPADFLTGRHLHALFLTLVSSVDQSLGDRLHEQKVAKPFTLSPLQTATTRFGKPVIAQGSLQWRYTQPIPAGSFCWWRVSLLDDQLFGKLTQLWLNLNPAHPWHLGPADLQITSILGTQQSVQPWSGYSSYTQLYEQASDQERLIKLSFHTPTTFRQGQFDSALPTKEAVFNSLLQRWNSLSGIPFSQAVLDPLFPSYFDIHTEMVMDKQSKLIGCVGEIGFRILGEVDALGIKQINALADFALYAGVGRKTPMGMGMTRRVPTR